MRKILIIISVFYITLFNISFAETGQILEDKSINEIKKDINKLHIDRNNIHNELTILTQDNNFISYLVNNGFFRDNINKYELSKIELLIKQYNNIYNITNNTLLEKSKNLEDIYDEKKYLLEIKKNLYQGLITYIKKERFNEYLDFIKGDASIIKRESDIKYSLIQNKEVLTTKVTKLEEKIQEQRKIMSDNIKKIVSLEIDKKIDNIKNNPKFIGLSSELQAQVIMKTIEKVELRIEKTKVLNNQDTILDQKIEIYEILHLKLMNYYETLNIKKEGE